MDKEIEQYFYEQYNKSDFKIVHYLDFKSKEEVDHWITLIEKLTKSKE